MVRVEVQVDWQVAGMEDEVIWREVTMRGTRLAAGRKC